MFLKGCKGAAEPFACSCGGNNGWYKRASCHRIPMYLAVAPEIRARAAQPPTKQAIDLHSKTPQRGSLPRHAMSTRKLSSSLACFSPCRGSKQPRVCFRRQRRYHLSTWRPRGEEGIKTEQVHQLYIPSLAQRLKLRENEEAVAKKIGDYWEQTCWLALKYPAVSFEGSY